MTRPDCPRAPAAQLGLFDAAPEPVAHRGLAAPPATTADPALAALAADVPAHVRFGTSSWTFAGWAGLVYARAYPNARAFVRESLAEYARHPLFRTVGIDRSYYAPLSAAELDGYARQLPAGFLAVSKVWSELCAASYPDHPRFGARAGRPNPSFLDPARFSAEVLPAYRGAFRPFAGPFVLELPPAPLTPARLESAAERFLRDVPRDVHYAFELRDRALLTARWLDLLRAHDASHVLNYWSRMPSLRAQLDAGALLGPSVVVRLMLPPNTRYEAQKRAFAPFDRLVAPQPEMRDDVVAIVRAAGERGLPTFVIVNNKAEGCAPLTVEALARRLAGRR
jgi:uncharacterized protein YecE (DUF72 family)